MRCIFCDIVNGKSPASFVYDDDHATAFTTIRATRPGETLVIPKAHVDHFIDLPDELAAHIMTVAQHIARKMMKVYEPLRIGYIVHGFGVAHAHLIVLPLHDPTDITSARHAQKTDDGRIVFGLSGVEAWPRERLDAVAKSLWVESISSSTTPTAAEDGASAAPCKRI